MRLLVSFSLLTLTPLCTLATPLPPLHPRLPNAPAPYSGPVPPMRPHPAYAGPNPGSHPGVPPEPANRNPAAAAPKPQDPDTHPLPKPYPDSSHPVPDFPAFQPGPHPAGSDPNHPPPPAYPPRDLDTDLDLTDDSSDEVVERAAIPGHRFGGIGGGLRAPPGGLGLDEQEQNQEQHHHDVHSREEESGDSSDKVEGHTAVPEHRFRGSGGGFRAPSGGLGLDGQQQNQQQQNQQHHHREVSSREEEAGDSSDKVEGQAAVPEHRFRGFRGGFRAPSGGLGLDEQQQNQQQQNQQHHHRDVRFGEEKSAVVA